MSRKRKKKAAGMTDNAAQAMYEYGKEKYELATRVTRGVDSIGSLAFAQHCSSYAKDGFKKGYDYRKSEELLKNFNVGEEAKRFTKELTEYCKAHGFYIGSSGFTFTTSIATGRPSMTIDFKAYVDQDKLKKLYIMRTVGHWRDKCCGQCKYHKIKCAGKTATCAFSQCSDEEALDFTKGHGCQGIREYLETGIFPERGQRN